ncbi:MAG TPA: UUP1 family membrane protein [Pseudomonadales bacterium]|nr:UUP1 family membrane protein [Pseudomonadales bacterium]
MKDKLKVYVVALLLALVGLSMALYKHFALGFPLFPDQKVGIWTVESKVEFEAAGSEVLVSLALPDSQQGIEITNENFTTSGYGFTEIDQPDGSRRAQWTRRKADGRQVLYYRLQIYPAALDQAPDVAPPGPPMPPEFDSAQATSASALLDEIHQLSANNETFVTQLLRSLTVEPLNENAAFLLGEHHSPQHIAATALQLLSLAGIPNRIVRGLVLEDGRRRQKLIDLVEVWDGDQWQIYDPGTASAGVPKDFVIWRRGDVSLLDVEGGRNSQVTFSILRSYRPARDVALSTATDSRAALVDFSIYSLPIEEQNAFKTILLVPIGTLVVAIFRILIGLRTSGTFMPILIALAFIQTTLLWGLLLFLIVVGAGLYIRFHLAQLNLLLIGRISAVVFWGLVIRSRVSFGAANYDQLSDVGHQHPQLQARTQPDPHRDLLPDDHPVVDDRADVDPVGGRRAEGGRNPGWGEPAGCNRRVSDDEQFAGRAPDVQFPGTAAGATRADPADWSVHRLPSHGTAAFPAAGGEPLRCCLPTRAG